MNSKINFLCSFLIFWVAFLLSIKSISQGFDAKTDLAKPQKILYDYSRTFQQQKVYIHMDKNQYIAGETIWLKGYIVKATNHLPDVNNSFLNVELRNINNEIVGLAFLPSEKGFAKGYLYLPDSLPSGNYILRGYTNWLRNFGSKSFFSEEIFIHNPIEGNFINNRGLRQNRRFNRRLSALNEEATVYFFPEGGKLVNNIESRVAFKAVDGMGNGLTVSGKIFSNLGENVTKFYSYHNGMGVFSFTPEPGSNYEAVIQFENGPQKIFQLPDALPNGYVLKADIESDTLKIKIKSHFDMIDFNYQPEIFILAQTRSQPFFSEKGSLVEGRFETSVPLSIFPTGICQLTIFDSNNLPLAERLVFINHNDFKIVDVSLKNDLPEQGHVEELFLDFDFGEERNSSIGFSISVTGSDMGFEPLQNNIVSNLFLTSELNQPVFAPWDYLSILSENQAEAIDLLMLTNGWRMFDWGQLLSGQNPEISYHQASGLNITGKLISQSGDAEIGGRIIEMSVIQDGAASHSTKTDSEGFFEFSDLFYEGVFLAEFSLPSQNFGSDLEIEIIFEDFPEKEPNISPRQKQHETTRRDSNWRRVRFPQTMQVPFLRTRGPEKSSNISMGRPDQVIYIKDLPLDYISVFEVLRVRATGLMVRDGQIVFRGSDSFLMSNEPFFALDNSPVNRNLLLSMSPYDLDRIEIYKGPSSAIFGVRGANGVIMAYSRKLRPTQTETVEYKFQGFQATRVFSPLVFEQYFEKPSGWYHTVLWEQNSLNPNHDRIYLYLTPDVKYKKIRVVVQGIDDDGKIYFGERVFQKKEF